MDKSHAPDSQRSPLGWGCFVSWLAAVLLALLVACVSVFALVIWIVFAAALAVGGRDVVVSFPEPEGTLVLGVAMGLIMTVCFGTVIGPAQWVILRRYVPRSALWMGVTLLGFLICSPLLFYVSGGAAMLSLAERFDPSAITPLSSLGGTAALGSSLGVAQWFILRKKVSRSARWIGISLVSWTLAGLIGLVPNALGGSLNLGPTLYWLGLFFAGTVLSAVGIMWWLRPTIPSADVAPA